MGVYAIIMAMILYGIIAVSNIRDKDYPHAFIWFSYALSQVGFLWYELSKLKVEQ